MTFFTNLSADKAAQVRHEGLAAVYVNGVMCCTPSQPVPHAVEIAIECAGDDWGRFKILPTDLPDGYDYYRIPVAELAAARIS